MADTQVPDNFQLWMTCSTIVLGKLLKGRDVAALTDSEFDDFLRSKTPIDLFSQLFFLNVRLPGMDESAFDRKFGRLQESGDISVIRRQMVDLIEGIMGHEKPENIYSIVVEIFNTLSSYTPQLHASPTVSTLSDTINSQILSQVQTHWNTPLIGRNVERLLGKLHEYEKEFRSGKYYAKTVVFVQSSGAGKSRLADEVGLYCPRVTYVIRDTDDGFPPCDEEILNFLSSLPTSEDEATMVSSGSKLDESYDNLTQRNWNIWCHALMVGIIQATFEKYLEYIPAYESELPRNLPHTLKGIANVSHEHMAPTGGIHSVHRQEFCLVVARRAKEIADKCIRNDKFCACFEKASASKIRRALNQTQCPPIKHLHTTLENLENALRKFQKTSKTPLFVLVFDEVASLLGDSDIPGKTDSARYIALNRVISCISEKHNFWYLLLSTQTKINDLLPPDSHPNDQPAPSQPSARVGVSTRLERFPPFSRFAVDIPDLEQKFNFWPGNESMKLFAQPRHMGIFGRPLWQAYDDPTKIAKFKLLHGSQRFDPNNPDHVFAIFSMRLSLDINLANPKTLPFAQTAVNLHMRKVKWVNPSSGAISTKTPNEPILSLAAMRHLLEKGLKVVDQAIDTFTAELLDKNSIDKGTEGELYSRLILTLAHDSIIKPTEDNPVIDSIGPIFTVETFLKHLYANDHHSDLAHVDEDIRQAHMNFLSFSGTKDEIPEGPLHPLFYYLLRRSTAMQLAPRQSSFDQLIPFYMGDLDEPFDAKKTGAILIQVKNRKHASTVSTVVQNSFLRAEPAVERIRTSPRKQRPNNNTTKSKYLFLLFDLGVDKHSVEVDQIKSTVWTIHSRGHDSKVFGCLEKMRVEDSMKRFFTSERCQDDDDDITVSHDQDLIFNFKHHDKLNEGHGGQASTSDEEQPHDTVMADA